MLEEGGGDVRDVRRTSAGAVGLEEGPEGAKREPGLEQPLVRRQGLAGMPGWSTGGP